MSSNIKVKRICEYCNNEFTARTTQTRYCSHKCNSRHYKAKQRNKKVVQSNTQTKKIKNQSIEELKAKEFLTVTEVSKLIGCSRQNVYKLIRSGKLKATNILEKKTIIRRKDIDKLFEPIVTKPEPVAKPIESINLNFDIAKSYTLTEIQEKYSISESALQQLIRRNNIPKVKNGWYAYVPKNRIDELLS